MEIDLSKYLDKEVRVTYRDGRETTGVLLHAYPGGTHPYKFGEISYTANGLYYDTVTTRPGDIIQIEELKPMIDLSQFVGKQVRVAYRSGKVAEGRIKINDSAAKPYILHDNVCSTPYTRYGRYFINGGPDTVYDLTHIEELKPVRKYEELERQVAEIQKEIDRLKREEKYPNLKPVEIVRTVLITPERYLERCEDYGHTPSLEGYEEYYCDEERLNDCFVDPAIHTQEIKTVEN